MINYIKKWVENIAQEKTEKILKDELSLMCREMSKLKEQCKEFEKKVNKDIKIYVESSERHFNTMHQRHKKAYETSRAHMTLVEQYLKNTNDLIKHLTVPKKTDKPHLSKNNLTDPTLP